MRNIEQLVRPVLQWTVAQPRWVLLIFLAGTATLGWQVRHFEIDASAQTLLQKDDPHYIQAQVVDRRFATPEFVLVTYRPRNWPVLSEETFADLRALSARIAALQRVQSVHSLLNVPLFQGAAGLSSEDLAEGTIERGKYRLADLDELFRGHPVYEDLLINRDQTATALQVLFKRDATLDAMQGRIVELQQESLRGELSDAQDEELERLQRQARPIERRLDEIRASEIETLRGIVAGYEDDADIYLGGLHVLGYQLIHIIRHDLVVFGGAIAAAIGLILFLLFRKLRWVVIPALCCACSLLSTMGLLGLLGLEVTVISANFIALQFILTLAIVMHLMVQYREYSAAHPDWDQRRLVGETLFRMAGPCFYSAFTSVVGFASLLTSGIQPVIAFGWMMMVALLISTVVSLLLFPAVMALFARERHEQRQVFASLLKRCSALALKQPVPIAVATGCVLAASVLGIFLLEVENSFINYFRDTTQVHRELSFIDQEFGGSTPLDLVYTLPAGGRNPDLLMSAGEVQQLQRVQQALKQRPAVGKVLSVVNVTELARTLNQERPLTEYELTANYWTMDEALRDRLLGSLYSPAHRQLHFGLRIKDTTPDLDRAELMAGIRSDLAQLGVPEERYQLTGLFVLYQDILQRLFRSQIATLGTAFAVLSLTFFAVFRSARIALIGITPAVLPTLALLGLMGALGIALDIMTITIAAITMGISVDDTIHFTHRYLEELKHGSPEEAIERVHASVGFSMLYTSLIIIVGFSFLALSDFVPSILFGLLTGFVMMLSLGYNLLLLPVMLRRFGGSPVTYNGRITSRSAR